MARYNTFKYGIVGLVSFWKLEEASGVRYDYNGSNSNDLSDGAAVGQSADSKEGSYSADFEASNTDYLFITDAAQSGLDITGNLTICFWIKPESILNSDLVSKWGAAGNKSYIVRLNTSGQILADLSSDGTATATGWTPSSAITAGTWYHVALVYNGTDFRIYIDGALASNGANNPKVYSSGIFNSATSFNLGYRGSGSAYYDGLKDEVVVFNRALTATEISNIYSNGVASLGTKYGTSPANANLLWTFMVDWDNDGIYDGVNEASRMVNLKISRGRDNFINPGGNGFERLPDGRFTAILNNDDGRYDPYNASSDLYPNVTPGKFFRLLVKNTNTGTNYPIMRGKIEDIQPIGGQRKQVRITGTDGLRWLRDRQLDIGLRQSVLISGNITAILSMVSWPTEWGSLIGTSVDTLDYWWAWQEKALDSIFTLEDAEVGHFWIDRDGKATFRGRDYSWSVRQTITQSSMLKEIITPQPWEVVRNIIRNYAYPKYLDSLNTILWQLRDTPSIANGATFVINAEYRYGSYKVCGSSITFTHTVNTQADGLGVDLTASCPLTYGQIGEGTEITIVNNSGSAGYITLLKGTGDAIYAQYSSIMEDSDSTSKSAYGPRVFTINSKWQEDVNIAKSLATQLLAELKDPLLLPVFQIEARPTVQFNLDVYDKITVTISELSINANYRVGKIEHEWLSDNGQAVRTIIKTEPYYELS